MQQTEDIAVQQRDASGRQVYTLIISIFFFHFSFLKETGGIICGCRRRRKKSRKKRTVCSVYNSRILWLAHDHRSLLYKHKTLPNDSNAPDGLARLLRYTEAGLTPIGVCGGPLFHIYRQSFVNFYIKSKTMRLDLENIKRQNFEISKFSKFWNSKVHTPDKY